MTELVATLLAPLTAPDSRTFFPALLLTVLVAVAVGEGRALLSRRLWLHRSSILDGQILIVRQLLTILGLAPRLGGPMLLATMLVRGLDHAVGVPVAPAVPLAVLSIGYSLALFVAWDASRYAVHRLMHAWEPLWRFHQVHHSAEVLTPMTFYRVHPVESLIYEIRGLVVTGALAGLAFWLWRGSAVAWTILGVNGLGLLLNAVSGNLRHSHVWIRFGPGVERWLLSPAQHQLHHAEEEELQRSNYGTWLAIWDRALGSLRAAPPIPPARYGLRPEERNHEPDDLLSAMIGPFIGRPGRLLVVLGLSLVAAAAWADDTDPPDDDEGMSVIVESEHGVPREPGSAHVIREEELKRYHYDDVGRLVTKVPGVYVRSEDGFGLRPNIGMRGGSSDRSSKVTLLEDGVPLVPAPYAAPAAYYFPMASRFVGVEVFKGASAVRHGPQTIGGAINVLTRPVPTANEGALDLGLGSYSTLKAHGWGALATPRFGVLFESANLVSGGFKRLDGGGSTGFERQDVMVKGRFTPDSVGAMHNLELKLGYGRERSSETYLGLNAEDFAATPYRRYAASADDEMRWGRGQAELSYKRVGERFDLRVVAYYHRLHRVWRKLDRFDGGPDLHDLLLAPSGGQGDVYLAILRGEEDSATADQNLMIGTNDRRFDSGGVQAIARARQGTGAVHNQLEIGARLHGDDVYRYQTEDPFAMRSGALVPLGGDTLVTLDSRSTALALASWVSDDLTLGPVRLSPGARVEAIRTSEGAESALALVALPGMGAVADLRPDLSAFAGVHRGFSPVSPGSAAGTKPETAWSYEAGVRATPGAAHAEAIGFLSDYDNITGQCTLSSGCDPDQVDRQYNGGAAWVFGVEALLSGRVPVGEHQLGAEINYTLTETRFRAGFVSDFPQFGTVVAGDHLPYVPEHQASAQLFDEHPRGTIAVAARARSAMRDVAGSSKGGLVVPATVQLDVAGEWKLSPKLSAYATATNLLGVATVESWRPFGARPAAPLQVMVGVKTSGR